MEAALFADSVGRSFGKSEVLKAATVWARDGRISALLGRNGVGKTTLLRAAVGLLRPEFGTVRFLGRLRTRPRLHRLAREGLFYLPERSLLSDRLTVAGHLREVEARFGTRWEGVVKLLHLGDHLEKRPWQLSGGERKRTGLAVALQRRPRCFVADEPFTGIAPKDRELVARGLRTLAEAGSAILITGHETESLLDVADEVIWMVAGTTHGLGSPAEARRHDQFRREYLGSSARAGEGEAIG